jgi:hypothetical protein
MTFRRGSGVRRGRTGWTICGARPDPRDEVRSEAAAALTKLRANGIRHLVMLVGYHPDITQVVTE